jgi:lysophospholipase L1-like esterase
MNKPLADSNTTPETAAGVSSRTAARLSFLQHFGLRPSDLGLGSCATLALLAFLLLTGCKSLPPNSLATHNSSKWQAEISAIEARDRTNQPPRNCIIFVGSSSIRLWKSLAADFPGLPVVNHGFGGSQLADSVNFADRIIIPAEPRQVVIYAGGNDINAGKSPEIVYGDFVALAMKIHAALPDAKIAFIASAPNPQRWKQVEKVKRLNSLVEAYCHFHDMDFINVFPLMLGPDGLPKPDIFVEDKLHMNPKGYAIWKDAVAPFLVPN